MSPCAATAAALALLLAGALAFEPQGREFRPQSLDLLRLLAEKPYFGFGPHNRWDRAPKFDTELGFGLDRIIPQDIEEGKYGDDVARDASEKRSAVATVLNGRRRRQPSPALGKAVTSYVGVGVLNDMGTYFDDLRNNLETLASLSPDQRTSLFQDTPNVVHAPASGGGGGSGLRKLHALRPLRPTGNIRSYNRRSFMEADGVYPAANHHDPGLLWTGLGR